MSTIRELLSMAGLTKPILDLRNGVLCLPDGYIPPRLTLDLWKDYLPVSLHAPESECVATSAVMYLMGLRVRDYGYDSQALRRIRAQRTRAKHRLSLACLQHGARALSWGISSRLVVRFSDGDIDYQVGQSENEEITNIMRRLVDPSAEWQS